MNAPTTPVLVHPREPAIDRATAERLAATEYERFVAQLRELAPGDWSAPTACPAWDVRAMTGHVLGSAEYSAAPEEQVRQVQAARERGGLFIDALTGLQVEEHAHLAPAELLGRLAAVAPAAARGRAAAPAAVRQRVLEGSPVDETGAQTESWTIGYLLDVIFTRDTWMHRSDIAAATGRPMQLTAEHDGVLVADVVTEWAGRHGQPVVITLSGPAGGHWAWGSGGETFRLDAVEFCRLLSGRGRGDGLLGTRVPF